MSDPSEAYSAQISLYDVERPDDERLSAYRDVRERDLVGRDGVFIIEGAVPLAQMANSAPHLVLSVLIARSRLASLAEVLSRLPANVPVYLASPEVIDAVAGFHLHRGILALARKPDLPPVEVLAARAGPYLGLGLIGLANHDNVGACLRNAAAFGVDAVWLEPGTCDPFYRKAVRVSAGTVLTLPLAMAKGPADMLAALARAGHTVWALTPDPLVSSLHDVLSRDGVPERLTLLVGAEGPGLPQDVLQSALPVRLPMACGVDSLNVATAAAVALSHVRLFRPLTPPPG